MKKPEDAPPLLLGAFLLSMTISGAERIALCPPGPPAAPATTFVSMSMLVALIWWRCVYSAVRDYMGVTRCVRS